MPLMKSFLLICEIMIWIGLSCCHKQIIIPGLFNWTHETVASTNLVCPDCCKDTKSSCFRRKFEFVSDLTALCCVERAVPFWMYPAYQHVKHSIKIKNASCNAPFVMVNELNTSMSVYDFEFQQAELSCLPDNLCEFPNIVEVNASHNKLDKLSNIGCLSLLDTLDLSNNQIRVIKRADFIGLLYLRYLDLSFNRISYIQPGTFKNRTGSLMHIRLSNNFLTTVDVTNLLLGYWFFYIDYSFNKISEVTNEQNWKGFRNNDGNIGGGTIMATNNNLMKFPTASALRFNGDIFKVGFNYPVQLGNNPWLCDCAIGELIGVVVTASKKFQGVTDTNMTCGSPTRLRGFTIETFANDPSLIDLLICNLTLKDRCPPKCECFQQPSRDRVVVNCASINQRKMPEIFPDQDKLDIDLSFNQIESFTYNSYLLRTVKLNLSNNIIHFIDPLVYNIYRLAEVDLRHNDVKTLHKSVLSGKPCKWKLGQITLKCSCEHLWIQIWLQRQKSQKCLDNHIICKRGSEKVNILLLTKEELCSSLKYSSFVCIILAAITVILLIIAVIYLKFRYEMQLVLRKRKGNITNLNRNSEAEHDVYLSFNIENDDIRRWTTQVLNPYLESRRYKVCIPFRDFDAGGIHVEQIRNKIIKSQSFIVILSRDFLESNFQSIEWKQIWNNFMCNTSKKLVVVNYDLLETESMIQRKMKALSRIGYTVDFCNFNNRLLTDIEAMINIPIDAKC